MRLHDLFAWRRRRDEDLDAEIASHLALAARDRVAEGEDPAAAHLAARKDFGNVTLTREATRLTWQGAWVERLADVTRDAAYAVRLIRRNPSYSFVVVAVLAVGIAANVIAFGLFKAVALAPLAGVERSGSLLFVGQRTVSGATWPASYPDYVDVRDRAFPDLAGWALQPLILGHGTDGRLVSGELVTGNYFDVLGVRPLRGRALTPADTASAGRPAVVVISDALWRRAFGADPAVIGTTIRLNSYPTTVVGVAPPGFHGAIVGLSTDVFVPMTMQPQLIGDDWLLHRDNRWVHPFMRPNGIGRAALEQRTAAVSRELMARYPNASIAERAILVPLWRWPYGAQTFMLPAVGLIGAMAALLLVVVTANVAGLVLVRSLSRRGETAARLTLGASRGRILRQLLIESLVLAVPGAIIGFLLPGYLEPFLGAAAANVSFPVYFNAGPDRLVVAFTTLLMVVSGVAYGLGPAIGLSRVNLGSALKEDLAPRGAPRSRLRTTLVVAQVAVALMLLVGTALILRTLEAAQRADAGFDDRNVTWATFDVRAGGHDERTGRRLYTRLADAVRAETGVSAASLAAFLPLNLVDLMAWHITPEGYQASRDEDMNVAVNVVGTDYLRTMGIALAAGRDFEPGDVDNQNPPLVVNETFARRFWGSPDAAIGRRLETGGKTGTVIGVARDIKYARLDEQPRPYLYAPLSHYYAASMTLQVRSGAEAADVLDRIRTHARALDSSMTILNSGVLASQVRAASSVYETVARVVVIIGALAAVLAALGVYGLVAYTVKQSAHEIGVRAAIGATRGTLLRHFLLRGLTLTAIGAAIGIAASTALSRLMSGILYGVDATDTASFVGASLLLLSAAVVASLVPAWRASRVDPVVALRHH